ncbi:MAG TPA: CaiB/BaiF CoA-transferase family protein [Kineosporiaceae bacterium]
MQPLEGIVVVAVEQAVAAPFATRQLADLGARVVKVERPGGGDFARGYDHSVQGQSSYFVWLNRGKESLELDLKDATDRTVLDQILDRADVFVQNLAPGATARLGLEAARLRAHRPRLVHCTISGYGTTGPYGGRKAYDLLVQCEAGVLDITGTADDPCKAGIAVADIAAGTYAYAGILAALYERERTGEGTNLEITMLDALGEWIQQPAHYSVYGGAPIRRTGSRHATISPYGPYRTGDGSTVYLGVQNDREWAVLCRDVLHRPDLVTDERFARNTARLAHDREITAIIEAAFRALTADDAIQLLDRAGIACARLRTAADLFEHPQLQARERWCTVDTPGGPIRALRHPITMSDREPVMRPVPRLGEHNQALRQEFGTRHAGPARVEHHGE